MFLFVCQLDRDCRKFKGNFKSKRNNNYTHTQMQSGDSIDSFCTTMIQFWDVDFNLEFRLRLVIEKKKKTAEESGCHLFTLNAVLPTEPTMIMQSV